MRNGRAPHPTLIGGKSPKVKTTGMLTFKNGKIVSFDNDSGHYKPNEKSNQYMEEALNKLYKKHPNLFHKESRWMKK